MAENQYIVKNLFPHNYPVVRGEFLRNPETLSPEKLTELVAKGLLEKVEIVPAADGDESQAEGEKKPESVPATEPKPEVKNGKTK